MRGHYEEWLGQRQQRGQVLVNSQPTDKMLRS